MKELNEIKMSIGEMLVLLLLFSLGTLFALVRFACADCTEWLNVKEREIRQREYNWS